MSAMRLHNLAGCDYGDFIPHCVVNDRIPTALSLELSALYGLHPHQPARACAESVTLDPGIYQLTRVLVLQNLSVSHGSGFVENMEQKKRRQETVGVVFSTLAAVRAFAAERRLRVSGMFPYM